jgi:hypothetical protein
MASASRLETFALIQNILNLSCLERGALLMVLKHAIGDVSEVSRGIWRSRMKPGEVRRMGEGKGSFGANSVVGVVDPTFDASKGLLYLIPDQTMVLNIGGSDDVLFFDLGNTTKPNESNAELGLTAFEAAKPSRATIDAPLDTSGRVADEPTPAGRGDQAFIGECERHLHSGLCDMAKAILAELRSRYPGHLMEGLARKWVNHPGNFVALTIQNRDQSFAVHVKGEPQEFDAPTLDIKPDRGSYSRFKLQHPNQLADALRVILSSARASEGY